MATADQINQFLKSDFPQCRTRVMSIQAQFSRVHHKVEQSDLRPGGTVSGPVMFAVADLALYAAILGEKGLIPFAVTTNININFLNKPTADKDLVADCRLIKVGKKLVVGDVFIFSEGSSIPVAHATGTYSIPPSE
ncbi:MAG: hypothetical protein ACI843_000575 [Psychrobacter glaciei]|jgi:uncharacterized protein (TIGR00369 family)